MRISAPLLLLCPAFALAAVPLAAQCPDGSPPPCSRPAARAGAGPLSTSVAVLYFDNLSRDTNDVYLAEGLTDELITRLGQVERLQVKSRNAVRRFRGDAAQDPAAVGRALGVAHLVSGSVRRTGDRVRVTVELTRAATGAHLWGDVIERTNGDLMSVESEVASAIATAVGGRLAPSEQRVLAVRPTTNPVAYDHMLRGDFLLARRTGADARRALDEYQAAAQLDPAFARAFARIALANYLFTDWDWPYPGLTRDSLLNRGFAAADRAAALDSNSADVWAVRGLLLQGRNSATHEGVTSALERAVRLDPRDAEAWHQLGSAYMVLRQDSAALANFRRALALDPQRWITLNNESMAYLWTGRYREALALLDSAVAISPDSYFPHVTRGFARLNLHDVTGAGEDADAALRLRPRDFNIDSEPLIVGVMMARGDTAEARRRARDFAASWRDVRSPGYSAASGVAIALAAVGDPDGAMEMLERGRAGGVNLWWSMQDPMLASLRGNPRFDRLLAELRPPAPR